MYKKTGLILTWCALYSAHLLYSASTIGINTLDARLWSPVYGFMLVGVLLWLKTLPRRLMVALLVIWVVYNTMTYFYIPYASPPIYPSESYLP